MGINVYDVGDLVRVTGTFTDENNLVADPVGLTFTIEDPAGVSASYAYPTNAEIVRASQGVYYIDVDASTAGDWFYRWASTGVGQTAEDGQFAVKPRMAG